MKLFDQYYTYYVRENTNEYYVTNIHITQHNGKFT